MTRLGKAMNRLGLGGHSLSLDTIAIAQTAVVAVGKTLSACLNRSRLSSGPA